ncbi:TonB-dependent receptor [Hymenobacter jeollabukensis]|uniref:Uncharacterized protein n=1 Tax=Hymenobacter jeollabukensis TaxID=2025313 RepID=A0A5R8WTY8_9BACT|nr:hypothetical protein [Hymenobacter jeollabukensis]TLM95238.1 hypothetical protein FDY95_05475 [Hymenobacter jeollabukensis]
MRRFVCRLGLAAGVGGASLAAAPAARAQLVPDGVTDPTLVTMTPPDTLVGVRLHARRIGVSTYTQQSEAYGRWHLGKRQTLLYRARTDWVLDSRGRPPFVREDYRADALHLIGLGRHWQVGQQVVYDYSHANHIRTVTWLGRAGGQWRLRPRSAPDSLSQLRVALLGGLTHDMRNGRQDLGPTYGAELTAVVRPLAAWPEPVALRLVALQTQLGPRRWQRALADAVYQRAVDDNSLALLRLGYRNTRTEDYLPANVQRIQSDTLTAQVQWTYQLPGQASFHSDNSVLLPARAFRYRRLGPLADTVQNLGYRQHEYDTRQELLLTRRKLQARVQFGYHERVRGYYLDNNRLLAAGRFFAAEQREKIKDISEKTTQWQAELTWLLRPRHALTAGGNAQLLRVDTPSPENYQDRDEASHQLRLRLTSRWHPTFRTSLGLWGEYRQLIFIKAQQSAENYSDRLLHWEPGFAWAPGTFSWRGSYHLWVSYQVRDRAAEQARNRASRVLELEQHLQWEVRPQWLLTLDYQRRENRIGQLNWQTFRESPLDTTILHDLSLGLRRGWRGVRGQSSLRAGYRFLEQRSHQRAALLPEGAGAAGLIYLRTLTRQHGPELSFERRSGPLVLTTSLWLQQLQNLYRYLPGQGTYIGGSSYTAEELGRRSSRLLPYFELLLEYQLRGRARWGR